MNSTVQLVLTIIHVLVCAVLIVTVLFQQSKSDGLGNVFSGSSETFFGKHGARSLDSKLAKLTAISAGLFIVLTFVLVLF